MRFVIMILIFGLITSCGVKKNAEQKSSSEKQKVYPVSLGKLNQSSDPFTIKSARVDKNRLILQVEFSGGCKGFSPSLIGSNSIMKSFPPKRGIQFILNKQGDCRELKSEEFIFDISDFAYKKEKGSQIILLLDGFDKPITYVFD